MFGTLSSKSRRSCLDSGLSAFLLRTKVRSVFRLALAASVASVLTLASLRIWRWWSFGGGTGPRSTWPWPLVKGSLGSAGYALGVQEATILEDIAEMSSARSGIRTSAAAWMALDRSIRTELKFKLPIVLWWTPLTEASNGVVDCPAAHGEVGEARTDLPAGPGARCFFTNDRRVRAHPLTGAVMFHAAGVSPFDLPLPRRLGEDWALLHDGSPATNPVMSQRVLARFFNHTSTFKRGSDLPLTLRHLANASAVGDLRYYVPLQEKNRLVREAGKSLGMMTRPPPSGPTAVAQGPWWVKLKLNFYA